MSDIVAATRTYLLTQSGVTDLVGTRIYYDNLPQGATLPAVVVYQAGEDLVRHIAAADTLSRHALMVDVFATTHASIAALGAALVTALEMQTGTWGTVDVRRVHVDNIVDTVESPRDGSDAFRHVRIMSCGAWAN